MKYFFKNNIKFLLIPLVSLIIIFSWFYEGKLISNNSEEDLNIYHSQKNAQYYSNFWYPYGTGRATPFFIVRYPTFFVLGIFEQMGIPAFLRQAILLWILMTAGISGMYLLLKRVFGISGMLALIGSFFYLLNIFSMTQVWKRFLYHGIFAWAYLPLFLFLWIKWIDTKRIIWLFLFMFTSVFFSYTFSQPAFLITIWVPAGIFILVKIWQSRFRISKSITIFSRSVIGLILWCLINIWWLYPTLALGSTWEGQFTESLGTDWQSSLNSLKAVSEYSSLWEVILLRQSWYLSSDNDFGSFYLNPFIILINILPFLFVIFATVKLKGYAYRGFLLTLAFVGLFISKGTSFPLGYTFFHILFSNFNFTTAFRNSYEKFGIVWLLAYTILFTLGFAKFLSLLKSKRYLFGGTILFLMLILVFPFWSGGVFPQKHRLNVPNYYNDANNYLKYQSDSRVFHIPFLLQLEKLTYTWGYHGQDPTLNLFDPESISMPVWPIYYRIVQLLPKFLPEKQFPEILGFLGVGNIILHKDSVYPNLNIEETIKLIEYWEGIESKKEFGELKIYSLNKELIRPSIYTATSVILVKSIEEGLIKIITSGLDTETPIFINEEIPGIKNLQIKKVPKITFKKISNDQYFVEVSDAIEPFILILNNTFDKLWQVKIDNNVNREHFMVNGFANGWLIKKTGSYQVDIYLKIWPWQ